MLGRCANLCSIIVLQKGEVKNTDHIVHEVFQRILKGSNINRVLSINIINSYENYVNPHIDIWNFELVQTYVSFSIEMLWTVFPPKDFSSIGIMLKETYINIAKSQCENLDSSNFVLCIH